MGKLSPDDVIAMTRAMGEFIGMTACLVHPDGGKSALRLAGEAPGLEDSLTRDNVVDVDIWRRHALAVTEWAAGVLRAKLAEGKEVSGGG